MWGAASILFRGARCSGTPVWACGSRSSRRSPHRVAPLAPGGRRAAPVAPQLGAVRGGGGGWGGAAPPPALGPEWEGGGSGGGPLDPWRRLLTAGGGAAWQSRPQGPAIGLGGRALPPAPST